MVTATRKPRAKQKPAPLGIDLEQERDRSFGIEADASRISRIPTGSIRPDPTQPRKTFEQQGLEDLAESLKSVGQIHPIHVREDPDAFDRYLLIAGERRWRAAQLASLEMIECIVKHEDKATEIQLIENLQREDLRPIEEAFAFRRFMEEHGLTQGELAKAVGKRQSTVSEILSLTTLPKSIRDVLPDHPSIPKSQLVLIAKERNDERQRQLWEEAIGGTLTVQRGRAIAEGQGSAKPRPERSRKASTTAVTLARSFESGARELRKLEPITNVERDRLTTAIEELRDALADVPSR